MGFVYPYGSYEQGSVPDVPVSPLGAASPVVDTMAGLLPWLGKVPGYATELETQEPHGGATSPQLPVLLGGAGLLAGMARGKKVNTVAGKPFEKVHPEDFIVSRDKTTRPEFLTPYGADDLSQMHVAKIPGVDAGYAVKSDGDIVNVFNNGAKGEHHGAMAVIDAIRNGGKKLDFYDSHLTEFYKSLGFKEVSRDAFDPAYMHKNWVNKYGKEHKPDVIYMEYRGGDNDPAHAIRMYETKWGTRLEPHKAGAGLPGAEHQLPGGAQREGLGGQAPAGAAGLPPGGVRPPIGLMGNASERVVDKAAWEKFIKSKEFRGRMAKMKERGDEYLKAYPEREWWDLHGTTVENTYPGMLPQAAAFIASTAPGRNPTWNTQHATEYMRRLIKNEPIVQPDWRAGKGLMTMKEGSEMPLEHTFRANLEKSSRGDIEALRADKVRSEAKALMGDMGVGVFDRWWARLAEKPSKGIFTAKKEGSFERAGAYKQLEDVVKRAAKAEGMNIRDYSARVWTGMREWVIENKELFGVKHSGKGIGGDSKGYAHIFDDLVDKKAEFLGISRQEMLDKLTKGDANLLSLVLSTGIGAAYLKDVLKTEE